MKRVRTANGRKNVAGTKEVLRVRSRTTTLAVALLLHSLPTAAQISTGTITGVIRDESRAVLPGVTVAVTSTAMPSGAVEVRTDASGVYRLRELEPGIYALTVSLPGYSLYEETGLHVSVAGTVERNVTLPLASEAETITVEGSPPVVDTRAAGASVNVVQQIADNVPTQRLGLGGFMAFLPGVSPTSYTFTLGGGMSVFGSSPDNASYNQDGVQMNGLDGEGFNLGDVDAVEEVNVQLLAPSAEFQRAAGGVMNVVTKSGTNQIQFGATGYWQPKDFIAIPITLDCKCPERETAHKWYIWRDYSFHAGGPIKRNRAWFHTGMLNVGNLFRNPGQDDIPKEFRWTRFTARTNTKLTWNVNDANTFRQTFYYEWYESSRPESPTPRIPLESVAWLPGEIYDTSTEWTGLVSSATALTARFTTHHLPFSRQGVGPEGTRADGTTPGRIDTRTNVRSGNIDSPQDHAKPRRDELSVKLNTYVSGGTVSHDVRGGFQITRTRIVLQSAWAGGVFFFDFDGAPDEALFAGPSVEAAETRSWGFWLEDEIRVGSRLTVMPGVRFDNMRAISPDVSLFDVDRPTPGGFLVTINSFEETGEIAPGLGDLFRNEVVSPRVGFNAKLTGDGKTILRGTAGWYFRPIDVGGGGGLPDFHPAGASESLFGWDPVTGSYSIFISETAPATNRGVDPDTRAERTDAYSVGFDREVGPNLSLHVTAVHKRSRDAIGTLEVAGLYQRDEVEVIVKDGGEDVSVTLPLLQLTTDASKRFFLRTNPPRYFTRYSGVAVQLTKRFSQGWAGLAGYSYGRASGIKSGGRDPNDFTNANGRLVPEDRPQMFKAAVTWHVPRVDAQISGNLSLSSGRAYGSQVRIRLSQGRRSIYIEPPGTYRSPFIKMLHLRFTKILFRSGHRHLELGAELRNALNETSDGHIASELQDSQDFGIPGQWAYPRQLMFMARLSF